MKINPNIRATSFGKLEITENYFKSPKVISTIKKLLIFYKIKVKP